MDFKAAAGLLYQKQYRQVGVGGENTYLVELKDDMKPEDQGGLQTVVQEQASIMDARGQFSLDERRKALRDSYQDKNAMSELNAARMEVVSNDVLAQNMGLSFFETIVLQPDQFPVVTNRHFDKPYNCRYLGENGGTAQRQSIERYQWLTLIMRQIASEEVEIPYQNIQSGDIDLFATKQAEVTYELDRKLDKNALAMVASGMMGATTYAAQMGQGGGKVVKTSGQGLASTLYLHPDVIAANIPQANFLDLTGVGTAGKLDLEKFKRLLDYYARFSADVEIKGSAGLTCRAIYLPSPNLRDLWDMAELVSGYGYGGADLQTQSDAKNQIPHEARMQIWESGTLDKMYGHRVLLVPRNTLAGPSGTTKLTPTWTTPSGVNLTNHGLTVANGGNGLMYCAGSLPFGQLYVKPSMDQFIHDTSPHLLKVNKTTVWAKKVLQMYCPPEWTYRAQVVAY